MLGALAGLRLGEVDNLLWSAFDWRRGVIRIENTEYTRLKSEDSAKEVDLDPEVMMLFQGFRAKAKGIFVIESDREPNPKAPDGWYRCQRVREKLSQWLREKGIQGHKPFHTLRKEFGSLINERHGLYAAKDALGHSQIATTAQYYVSRKSRVTVGLGELFRKPENVVTMHGSVRGEQSNPPESAYKSGKGHSRGCAPLIGNNITVGARAGLRSVALTSSILDMPHSFWGGGRV